jgi:hypothetical protein
MEMGKGMGKGMGMGMGMGRDSERAIPLVMESGLEW